VLNDGILISGFTMICDHFASLIESGAINNINFKDIEIQGPDFNIIKNNISNELNNKIGKENNGNNIWQFNEVKNNLEKILFCWLLQVLVKLNLHIYGQMVKKCFIHYH